MVQPEVFISYSTADHVKVNKVYQELEKHKVSCWRADLEIRVQENFREQIVASIRAARLVLVLLSKNSMASEHVKSEISLAFNNLAAGRTRIMAFRLDYSELPAEMEYNIGRFQFVNPKPAESSTSDEPDLEADLPKLVTAVFHSLAKPLPKIHPVRRVARQLLYQGRRGARTLFSWGFLGGVAAASILFGLIRFVIPEVSALRGAIRDSSRQIEAKSQALADNMEGMSRDIKDGASVQGCLVGLINALDTRHGKASKEILAAIKERDKESEKNPPPPDPDSKLILPRLALLQQELKDLPSKLPTPSIRDETVQVISLAISRLSVRVVESEANLRARLDELQAQLKQQQPMQETAWRVATAVHDDVAWSLFHQGMGALRASRALEAHGHFDAATRRDAMVPAFWYGLSLASHQLGWADSARQAAMRHAEVQSLGLPSGARTATLFEQVQGSDRMTVDQYVREAASQLASRTSSP